MFATALPAGAQSQEMEMAMDDRAINTFVLFDELEYLLGSDARLVEFDGRAWVGGDFTRVWAKYRGEHATRGNTGHVEGQLLYGRVIAPFWDAQAGLRVDSHYGDGSRTRGLLVLSLQGLAPYWFELGASVFASQQGNLSARIEASYELLLTQRLVLEPEIELNVAAQDVPEFGVSSGFDELEFGARFRYEIVREFAPYFGISRVRQFGEGRAGGETSWVAGLRWWY
jgi:copper resistance protein B